MNMLQKYHKIFDKTNLDKKEEEPKGMFDDVELSESEKIPENATADEILKEMQAEVDKKAKQKKQKRLDEYKSVAATKSLLSDICLKSNNICMSISENGVQL